ncbi:Ig-like domain-containing protein [Microbulbifer pacificus]|uniref:Ig-like domain-containing protein n=1 Tax=Microbulbifer pacificus TaxID=407164 RepID=UPI001319D1CC|nr:Ig-like domain-containing protein [Microbulbifer pacificus]
MSLLLAVMAVAACGGSGGGGSSGGGGNSSTDDFPTATDDTAGVKEDTSIIAEVLSNDDFGNDGAGSFTLVTTPEHGVAEIEDGGTPGDFTDDVIRYTPKADFNGTDQITYQITDRDGDATSATLTITVHPVTDFLSASAEAGGDGSHPRRLHLAWAVDSEPDHYRIQINPDGVSGYTDTELGEIAGGATSLEFDMSLHLTSWESARLQLVALDSAGIELGRSGEIPLDQVAVAEMIGYFKAPGPSHHFGISSALSADGTTLAIAAEESNRRGAVYVFYKNTEGWQFQKKIVPLEADDNDYFGFRSLALSADGNTLAVGARYEDSSATGINGDDSINVNASFNAGAAYVFRRNAGDWTQQAYIKGANTGEGDQFGVSVALSANGAVLAVGANGEDSDGDPGNNSTLDSGAIYLFANDGSGWVERDYLKGNDVTAARGLGYSLALSSDGNTLASGAVRDLAPGGIYVFTYNGSSWDVEAANLTGSASDADALGSVLVLSDNGDTLAASALYHDAAAANAGAVFVYRRNGAGWGQQAQLTASNPDADDIFGYSLSMSGDGTTLAVGSPYESSDSTGLNGDPGSDSAVAAGAVYVYQFREQWQETRYVKAPNTEMEDIFGSSVALSASGSTLFVGSAGEDGGATGLGGDWDSNDGTDTGAVFAY